MEGLPKAKIYIQRRTTTNDDFDSDNDSVKVLYMAIDTKEITNDHEGSEEEGEVDLEER